MRAADWIGRTLLLVLSGLATMAMLTSIASVSDDAFDSAMTPQTVVERPESAIEAPPGPSAGKGRLVPSGDVPASPGEMLAEKLDALTYAVLALAGFAAAILIVLLRITAHLSRIAER